MKITRSRETSDFTITPNSIYRDTRLSYRALGILAYLLHLPDGYELDSADLAADRTEGRDAIRAALKQLEQAGYLTRQRRQDPATGRWRTHTSVSSHPQTPQVAPKTENQASGNQAPDANPQVTPETDFQASEIQSSDTRTSGSQALTTPSTDTKDHRHGHPPLPGTDRARQRASGTELAQQLNQTATNINTLQLVNNWQNERGHHYTRTDLTNLAHALDAQLDDGADPNLFPTTLDIQHAEGHSPNFIPHAYRQAVKQADHGGDDSRRTPAQNAARGPSRPSTTDTRMAETQALRERMRASGQLDAIDQRNAQRGLLRAVNNEPTTEIEGAAS